MKSKRNITIVVVVLGLLASLVVGYPLYAQHECSLAAGKHKNYLKDGEIYLVIDHGGDQYPSYIKQSEFNTGCMQSRFSL